MAVSRDPNKPPPPPDLRSSPGAHSGPLVGTSVIESGLERDARLAREAAAALPVSDSRTPLPAPMSELGEAPPLEHAPPGQAPPAVRAAVAWKPPQRRERIEAPPLTRVESESVPPVSMARTLDGIRELEGFVPDTVVSVSDGAPVRVIIDVIRPAEMADMRWAVPRRVGSMIPLIRVGGDYVRYCATMAARVESVTSVNGKRVVHVTVCYSPDPGRHQLRQKFMAKQKRRLRQLHAALTVAFVREAPVRGLVLHLVGAPPTMSRADANTAGYLARAGSDRAPVRAEFVHEFVASMRGEDEKLYREVRAYPPVFRECFLIWLWCSGWLWRSKNHERLASYVAGGSAVTSSVQVTSTAAGREETERQVAVLACWPMASLSTFVWADPILRSALLERGEDVKAMPGTELGTFLGEPEEAPEER